MREILFRGKRKLGNEWIEGSLHTEKFADDEEYLCCEINQCDVYPETVGQYTGLTDKNGTKIFEGDILHTPNNSNCTLWYVDYKNTAFCCNQGNANYSCVLDEFMQYSYVRIIGNIHDNPELLEAWK